MHAAKRRRGHKFLNREEKLDPEGRYWSPLEMLDICTILWTEQNIAEHDYAKEKKEKGADYSLSLSKLFFTERPAK